VSLAGILYMLNLCHPKLSDMLELVHRLRHLSPAHDSMEAVAQRIVATLFDELVDNDGRPACVMARLFVTRPLGSLPEPLRQHALARLTGPARQEPDDVVCLTLLGSRGIEPAWNGRQGSVNHDAIPLPSPDVLIQFPMVSTLIEQLGIDRNLVVSPDHDPLHELEPQVYQIFHIEKAVGSSAVPAQAGFVDRYGIQSVLGFGSLLPGASLYAVLLFTRVRVSAELASRFRPLALSAKLSLLPFINGSIFDGEKVPRNIGPASVQSRVLALETLLDVKEAVALEQTRNLEKQSQEMRRFQLMSAHSSDGMFFLDRDARVVYVNAAACRRLGYSEQELSNLTVPDFDPDYDLPRYQALFDAVQAGNVPAFETRHCRKDGSIYPIEIVATAIQFESQSYILCVVRDITDRKAAEAARISKERYYQALAEGTLDAIVVTNADSRIWLFNAAAEKLFGYSEQEALGQCATILMPQEDQDRHLAAIQRYVQTRNPTIIGRTIEVIARRKNGERFPVELGVSSIELPEGLFLLASFRDLTERNKMQLRVAQAEKLASLGLLSAGVAHEINNPLAYVASNLAVIEMYTQGLLELIDAMQPAKAVLTDHPELLQTIENVTEDIDLPYIRQNLDPILASTRKGVNRIAEIVKNLRGFTRIDRAAVEPVDLREVVSSSLEMLKQRFISHGIEVVREDAPCPPILCLVAQINQVVLNLLVNAQQAIDATLRSGGKITIRTRAEPPWGIIEIQDNGAGIAPEVLPRLFEPFFTTKPVGQGTGLGLPICHGIVSDHQGRIEVSSEPGQGARFTVYLPIAGREAKT